MSSNLSNFCSKHQTSKGLSKSNCKRIKWFFGWFLRTFIDTTIGIWYIYIIDGSCGLKSTQISAWFDYNSWLDAYQKKHPHWQPPMGCEGLICHGFFGGAQVLVSLVDPMHISIGADLQHNWLVDCECHDTIILESPTFWLTNWSDVRFDLARELNFRLGSECFLFGTCPGANVSPKR